MCNASRTTHEYPLLSLLVVKQFRENRRCKYRTVQDWDSALATWVPFGFGWLEIRRRLLLEGLSPSRSIPLLYVLRFLLVSLLNILLLPSIASTSTLLRDVSRHFWVLREYISHLLEISLRLDIVRRILFGQCDQFSYIDLYEIASNVSFSFSSAFSHLILKYSCTFREIPFLYFPLTI